MTLILNACNRYYKYVESEWSQPVSPSGISATAGWGNVANAFDRNTSTYASCGTSTDYIEYYFGGAEIKFNSFYAEMQYVASQARACNMAVYAVADNGVETLLCQTSNAAEGDYYTVSVGCAATWVKRLRFRLIAGPNGNPTTSYPTRVREITVQSTIQRVPVESTADDYDFIALTKNVVRRIGQHGVYCGSTPIKQIYKGSQFVYDFQYYYPGTLFFESNEPVGNYVYENDLNPGTYRLRLGAPGGGNWTYIGTNRGGGGAGIDCEFELKTAAHVIITVGSKGTDSKFEIRNPSNSAEFLTIVNCGRGSDAGGTWGGGAGGVLTVNSYPNLVVWNQTPYVWSNGIDGVGSGTSDTQSIFSGQEYSRGDHHGTGRLEYLRRHL